MLVLIRPTEADLDDFGEPDFTIYNAGQFPANRFTSGMTSATSVEINFKRREMVILGTEYAGEMKKGIFSVMVSIPQVTCLNFNLDNLALFAALSSTSQVRPVVVAFFGQRRSKWGCFVVLRSFRHWKNHSVC
jgi:ATP-dependent phosphoenolpyruvate carboxykinase